MPAPAPATLVPPASRSAPAVAGVKVNVAAVEDLAIATVGAEGVIVSVAAVESALTIP